eukprot:6472221-Pyramimonas_sp.AAC.1
MYSTQERKLPGQSRASLSSVTIVRCDRSTNHVPPLRTVRLDSRSEVGAEALGRLPWTKLPPPLVNPPPPL